MSPAEDRTRSFTTWAGFAAGPLAALVYQQVGQVMTPWTCARDSALPVAGLGVLLALATAAAGWASWRARRSETGHGLSPGPGNRRFVAGLSAWMAAFFVLVILAQAWAAVFLTGCER